MKFLSNEWFDTMIANAKAAFSKPGKLSLTYSEVFTDIPGENDKWLFIELQNGMISSASYGSGKCPDADYVGSGKYDDHVKICKGILGPKKAVMDGIFVIKDNVKAGAMRTIQLIGMYNKLVEAKDIPGVEY